MPAGIMTTSSISIGTWLKIQHSALSIGGRKKHSPDLSGRQRHIPPGRYGQAEVRIDGISTRDKKIDSSS